MPILHVRGVPQELYLRLKQRAKTQRRSLGAEVIALLEWATEEVDRASKFPLESNRHRHFFEPASVGVPDSTTLLREDASDDDL
jgi:plasmid stability protein